MRFDRVRFWICRVGGAVLLVVGLYSVLWGKSKDGKSVTNDAENPETKEETILESTTSTNHWLLIRWWLDINVAKLNDSHHI